MTSPKIKRKKGSTSNSSLIPNNTHLAHEKDGTPWIVDEHGNKIKKVRKKVSKKVNRRASQSPNARKKVSKKVSRRASVGHSAASPLNSSQSSIEFGTSASLGEFRKSNRGRDGSNKKTKSCRTVATEMSSSHHSSDHKDKPSLSFRSPKSSSSKSSSPKKGKKKPKSVKEIDGQWWRIDDEGVPINKVQRKKKGLSQSEVSPSSSSFITPVSQKKKKKKKSSSLEHLSCNINSINNSPSNSNSKSKSKSNSEFDYGSGHESPPCNRTVDTTGTGSTHPRPRRPKSQPEMCMTSLGGAGSSHGLERKMARRNSGDLDMLMCQSVHEHVRTIPLSAKKPKLKPKSTLGKIGKKLGKSVRGLGMSSNKNLNPNPYIVNTNFNEKRDQESTRSFSDDTNESVLSNKPLPKDVREIDGILWRVDENGNKLNKVRRKSPNINSNNTSGDETDHKSHVTDISSSKQHQSTPTWSSDDDSFTPKRGKSPRRKQQRRSSMGTFSPQMGKSLRKKQQRRSSLDTLSSHNQKSSKPDSERSLYTDFNDTNHSTSMDHITASAQNETPSTSLRQNTKRDKEHQTIVQNLQHRLKNSEKEIARLCRVTIEQQDSMDESKTEVKKLREKIKLANQDKRSLMAEMANLKLQIEKRKDRSDKSLNGGTNKNELREQVCDLEGDKESLEKQLASEKAIARLKLDSKEEEVRFLQEELERMRSEQGKKELAYMQKISSAVSDDEESNCSPSRNSSPHRRRSHGKSLQFVGKILGNHLKDKAETEAALQQEEIKNLQARVFSLQQSNEKLTKELKQATLEIKEDDDEDIRFAKEAAARAAEVVSLQKPRSSHSISLSFRGGVGDCVRRQGSMGGSSEFLKPDSSSELSLQSFRINRKADRKAGLY
jgi:hypothetical protein